MGLLVLVASCGGGGSQPAATPGPPQEQIPPGLVKMPPGTSGSLGLRIFPASGQSSRWCVFRGWPDERLYVFADCDSAAPQARPFARAEAGGLLLVGAADGGDRLWLLTYDADRNIPSGRMPGIVSDGVDILLFTANGAAEPRTAVERMSLGSFDNLVYSAAQGGALLVCAIDRCSSISDNGVVTPWALGAMSGYEFVEAVIRADSVEAIVRRPDEHVTGNADLADFHYAAASLRADRAEVTRIAADCVPYALTVGVAGTTWKCARTRADLVELLRLEIARMPNDGMVDFGASNLEGRVAWSQAYYLNGLMQLGGSGMPALGNASDWTSLRARLRAEVDLLAQRVQSAQGLTSKRYSMQRTAVTFALHGGRAARILGTAATTGHGSAAVQGARALLQTRLRSLDGTVEQPAQGSEDGFTFPTLGYARGSDFWCDGANVPYNYISGVVDGVLAADDVSTADIDRLSALMQPLLALELIESAPMWRYWWSRGSDGWSAADNVSTNTPDYGGNSGAAHITYRSMDAAALVRLHSRRAAAVPADVIANIRTLVASGGLLPWVNEALLADGTIALDAPVAYRYARSSAPWELQSQVWALEQLAQGSPP